MERFVDAIMHPTGFDSAKNYMGELPAEKWLVVLGRNRDSDLLTECNWGVALKELGDESDEVQIFRVGHWACGWIEYLCIRDDSDKLSIAEDIERCLDDYPVLCESTFSEREQEEAHRVWEECYDEQGRIDYIRRFDSQFEFQSMADLIGCVRGKYFAGYASELIY